MMTEEIDNYIEEDNVIYPDCVIFNEREIDKKTYSAKRFNKNFYAPKEPAAIFFIGPRGCGKTTAMLNCIDIFDYDTLSIYSASIKQPKFIELGEEFIRKGEEFGVDLSDRIIMDDDLSDIISGAFIQSRDPTEHHLVIIDDFVVSDNVKSKAFKQLILNGRPVGITSLMSTQTFTGLEKCLRDNATHLAFFKGVPPQDIRRIARNYVPDVTPIQFERLYRALDPKTPEGEDLRKNIDGISNKPFLLYDRITDIPNLIFRIGFDICFESSASS